MLKKLEEHPKLLWFIIILYMSLIFYFSSISYPPQPMKGVKEAPIIEHIIEFAILGILLIPGFRSLKFWNFHKNAFIFALIFGILYGISDEVHQHFVPGRCAELIDVIANSVGVILGVLFVKLNSTEKKGCVF